MTATQEPPAHATGVPGGGFPSGDLTLLRFLVEQALSADTCAWSESELVDQIQEIEALQASLAALQSTRIRAFARSHVENGPADLDPEKLHRSVVAQIQLACRVSTAEARTRAANARDLHSGLDWIRGLHRAGELSAAKVSAIAVECRDLNTTQRARVDSRLAAVRDLTRYGIGRLRAMTRRLVAEIAPDRFRARVHAAKAERRVTLRPAPDAMSYLTAYVPVEQGAACLAALQKAFVEIQIDPEPLTRTRGQVLADTLVERVTGQATATAVNLEVQVTVPIQALLDPTSPLPAEIPGFGPVPADLLATPEGTKSLRRLLTDQGIVIGGDSRKRTFTGLLATLVKARAGNQCTEPYCDAPVRHLDHIHRDADGGRTELDNGRGVCEFHNHVREQPGWQVFRAPDGIVVTVTPTGHRYCGPAPPLPPAPPPRAPT
ncbi:HNH endonuclease signature motif containing protein [Pseudonocardia sp. ICBG601]|uniref:HNH endonuclease n=1 Tax=Pseudonocardia sp. ICBG601 TaxID=2846759 RepID=UPI001CF65059|nr:HNH endonuclease signature motif containing protein [Pseudonocardia sp. ICBG601]